MKEKEIQHIREDIPITGYDPETNSFYCGDGSHILMYQIRSKDLVNSDPDEIEMDCFRWAKFYKTYGKDIEIVTMLFPCNTGDTTGLLETADESQSESSVSGYDRAESERAGVEGNPYKNERILSALFCLFQGRDSGNSQAD